MKVIGQLHVSAALSSEKQPRCFSNRGLGGTKNRFESALESTKFSYVPWEPNHDSSGFQPVVYPLYRPSYSGSYVYIYSIILYRPKEY
jgi:hypothetical protein